MSLIRQDEIKIKLLNTEAFFFSIFLFLLSNPYFAWGIPDYIFLFPCILIALNHVRTISSIEAILLFIINLLYSIISFRSSSSTFGYMYIYCIFIIFLIHPRFLVQTLSYYINIYSITISFSILQYILVVLFGIDMSNTIIEPLNPEKLYTYNAYLFFITDPTTSVLHLFRFEGLYDEPGVVGTISGVLLYINKFNLKRLSNIPILIAGSLSFSLAFYIMLILYIVLFASAKYKILFSIIIALIIIFLFDNEIISSYLLNRLEFKNGAFNGDTRTSSYFDMWYDNFKYSLDYFYGLGYGASLIYNKGGSSYKDMIVNYGFIYFATYMITFIFWSLYRIKSIKIGFLFCLMFCSTMYHRPICLSFFWVFIFFSSIFYLNEEY